MPMPRGLKPTRDNKNIGLISTPSGKTGAGSATRKVRRARRGWLAGQGSFDSGGRSAVSAQDDTQRFFISLGGPKAHGLRAGFEVVPDTKP
jgi:hypothetical protein